MNISKMSVLSWWKLWKLRCYLYSGISTNASFQPSCLVCNLYYQCKLTYVCIQYHSVFAILSILDLIHFCIYNYENIFSVIQTFVSLQVKACWGVLANNFVNFTLDMTGKDIHIGHFLILKDLSKHCLCHHDRDYLLKDNNLLLFASINKNNYH